MFYIIENFDNDCKIQTKAYNAIPNNPISPMRKPYESNVTM